MQEIKIDGNIKLEVNGLLDLSLMPKNELNLLVDSIVNKIMEMNKMQLKDDAEKKPP